MTRLCLRHVDETKNMRRFYAVQVQPTLFGEWELVREFGRIGSPGRVMVDRYATEAEAAAPMRELHREKVRKGYQ